MCVYGMYVWLYMCVVYVCVCLEAVHSVHIILRETWAGTELHRLLLGGEGVAFVILSGSVQEETGLFLKDPAGSQDCSGLKFWSWQLTKLQNLNFQLYGLVENAEGGGRVVVVTDSFPLYSWPFLLPPYLQESMKIQFLWAKVAGPTDETSACQRWRDTRCHGDFNASQHVNPFMLLPSPFTFDFTVAKSINPRLSTWVTPELSVQWTHNMCQLVEWLEQINKSLGNRWLFVRWFLRTSSSQIYEKTIVFFVKHKKVKQFFQGLTGSVCLCVCLGGVHKW